MPWAVTRRLEQVTVSENKGLAFVGWGQVNEVCDEARHGDPARVLTIHLSPPGSLLSLQLQVKAFPQDSVLNLLLFSACLLVVGFPLSGRLLIT